MTTENEQDKPCVNPIEDKRREALRHYEEAARIANHWSSFVRDAILAYNPIPEQAKPTEQPKSAEEILLKIAKKSGYDYFSLVVRHYHPNAVVKLIIDAMTEYATLRESSAQQRIKELEEQYNALGVKFDKELERWQDRDANVMEVNRELQAEIEKLKKR